MFKKLVSLVLVILFSVGLLAGCQQPAKKPAPKSTAKKTAQKIKTRSSADQYPPAPPVNPGNVGSEFQRRVVELVNIERQKVGNDPLMEDGLLDKGAGMKATDMGDKGYFSHKSPTYGNAFKQMNTLGVRWQRAGENIAEGYKTPEAVMKGWMNSPGHRANILSIKFGKMGVGYDTTGRSGPHWVQWFTN